MAFLHRRELLWAGGALMGRLRGLVGHAVDGLAALVLAHVSAFGIGFFLKPIGQAVSAETRQIHQIDILDIRAGAPMLDKAPEDGGFKFRSGFVVNRHRRYLAVSLKVTDIKWELSQILPYRSANRALTGGNSATYCLKIPLGR